MNGGHPTSPHGSLIADALRKIARRAQIIDGNPVALSDALADIEREALGALDIAGEPRG